MTCSCVLHKYTIVTVWPTQAPGYWPPWAFRTQEITGILRDDTSVAVCIFPVANVMQAWRKVGFRDRVTCRSGVLATSFKDVTDLLRFEPTPIAADRPMHYTVCPKKSEPLNILQQQPQICSDLNKILRTQDDICYKHYYIVSYKSTLTLLKY